MSDHVFGILLIFTSGFGFGVLLTLGYQVGLRMRGN